MYYAEEIINGVLCWKNDPDGEWRPFSAKELTVKLMEASKAITYENRLGGLIQTYQK